MTLNPNFGNQLAAGHVVIACLPTCTVRRCLDLVFSGHVPVVKAPECMRACLKLPVCVVYPALAHEPAVRQAKSLCGMFTWEHALQHAKNGVQASSASFLGKPLRQASSATTSLARQNCWDAGTNGDNV